MSITDALQLNKTEMFAKIRENLAPSEQSQNLLECKDDLLFAWDTKEASLLVTNWRLTQFNQSGKPLKYQTIIPSTPLNFEVDRVVASIEGSLIAILGVRGVAIVELPRRWGQDGQFMNGKSKITCRTHILDAHFFINNQHLEVRQLRWHPGSTTDSHLLILLSDNTIRVYNNAQLRHVWQVGPLPLRSIQSNKTSSLISAFGEIAVDFDIAPPIKVNSVTVSNKLEQTNTSFNNSTQLNKSKIEGNSKGSKVEKVEWPIVVLRENGNIYVLMAGLDTEKTRLQGPITISPQSRDNYGVDSCSILVIPSLPPTLVIAESSGSLHHALLLEAESAEDSFSEVDVSLNIHPSEWTLHVLETVKLELGLPKSFENNTGAAYSCPIHLKRDYINETRYFAYHNAGLHVITVNFISELQRYVESEVTGDISLTTPSRAEYIVCTKIDASEHVNAVLGFVLLQMPASLVILLSSGQIVSLKVVIDPKLLLESAETNLQSSAIGEAQMNDESGPTFVEHIKSMLQRTVSQPILSLDKTALPTPHECYEILNQAMEVLRTQYLQRHESVRNEFSKRINRIRLQKEQQLQEIQSLEHEREIISERAHKLAERFEEISEDQELIVKKCQDLMRQTNMTLPGNTLAEREFTSNVVAINKATILMTTTMENVKKTMNKQSYHIAKANEATKLKSFELPEKQQRTISEILAQMATEIDRQINDVKRINKLVGV